MTNSISLAIDVASAPGEVFKVLSTSEGQRSFWTDDCDVASDHARFGFAVAPVDLVADVELVPNAAVRMKVTSGFPFWEGSTWEWELEKTDSGTGILFRHFGFGDGYEEKDLAHTAQSWALILDRLERFLSSGEPQPYFATPAG